MLRFETIERGMTRFAAWLALLGGAGLIFATLVTCVSIILKMAKRGLDHVFTPQVMNDVAPWLRSILGEEELVTYGVGFALFAALPWAMIQRGHIKVDLLGPMFSDRFNRILDLLGDVALAVIAYLILTRQWFLIFKKARGSNEPMGSLLIQGDFSMAADRLRSGQESQILGVQLWPTYIVAEIFVAFFLVVACFCVWRSLRGVLGVDRRVSPE